MHCRNRLRFPAAAVLLMAQPLHAAAPLIAGVPDQVIAQDTSTPVLYFTIGDNETAFGSLNVTASSGNPALIPNQPAHLALGGSNAQRSITVTPSGGLTGTSAVTLTVTDGDGLTAGGTFNVTVTTPNTPPMLTALAGHQIAAPGEPPPPLSFTVGDAETPAASLVVSATSSNTGLVPNGSITLVNNGANRTVQITPVPDRAGAAIIRLRVADALGASAQGEFLFSVFDAGSANNRFPQMRGLYVLDSSAGTQVNGVSMHDSNIRDKPFVDGYVLRTEWSTLEPMDGVFDFTIIDNIFSKLPAGQRLSLMLASGSLPPWLNALPGITTYTAGSPPVTRPYPWDPIAQERLRLLLAALGAHAVDGVPLRDHPRLAVVNMWIPGLKSGIRDPDEIKIRNMTGYSRTAMETAVLTHLANVTDNFPLVPVQIGFWTYVDNQDADYGGTPPWEQLRLAILAQHDGITRPRVGFWMENLAANRPAAGADPPSGLPNHTFTAPLYNSQNQTFIGYQVLGSWSRPFNSAHVDNNLNGSPGDGMHYGFNDYQCRYYEHYQTDVDFAAYTAEFQRWHDFLAALPGPPLSLNFGSSQGGVDLGVFQGGTATITLQATGGTAPYAWSVIAGTLPAGITLDSAGVLSGSSWEPGLFTFTVQAADAMGGTASQTYTLAVDSLPPYSVNGLTLTRNTGGSFTLDWPSTPGGWYQVGVSEDLLNWRWIGNSTTAPGTSMTWTDDGTRTGAHPSSVARRFYHVRDWGVFTTGFTNTTFTYTDAHRSVSGMFVKPSGAGPFPALIINHGTGGTAGGFSRTRANEMSPWGLVCIGADLTHKAGETENLETWGNSPENLARIRACQAALSTRDDVDLNRLALWGHSRGAFAAIGAASDLGADVKVLGFTEGGILENTGLDDRDGQPEHSFPTLDESTGIMASTLIFHVVGDPGDTVVVPSTSQRLKNLLDALGTPNSRITYDSTGVVASGSAAHNIYTTPFYPDVLAQWQAWLIAHGVLP